MQSKVRLLLLVLLGVMLAICGHFALKGLAYLAYPSHKLTTSTQTIPLWYAFSRPLFAILVQVLPPFLVGWWARRSGFLLGALVGFVSSLAVAGLFNVVWQHVGFSDSSFYIELLLVWALPSAISASVAGAAGQLARSGRPLTIHSSGRRSGAA